ncbi:MAG: hypothetical protein IEMM0008_0939 [bacterium]|nr:MAG: hypothetical protein IEMM0008_0939 [bacterium]
MKSIFRFTFLLMIILSLSKCFSFPSIASLNFKEPVKDIKNMKNNEMVVVGRIELDPPLKPGEQIIPTLNNKKYKAQNDFLFKDIAMMNINYKKLSSPRDIAIVSSTRDPMNELYNFKHGINAKLEKTFYVKSENKSFYIIESFIIIEMSNKKVGTTYIRRRNYTEQIPIIKTTIENLVLPGGYKVNTQDGDKAIYIGTLKYTRDEFNQIINSKIIDNYKKENMKFVKKFGTKYKLRKSLAYSVNN